MHYRIPMKQLLSIIIILLLASGLYAQVKNTYEEVIPYREVDGKIMIRASVGGEEGDFILDSRGGLVLFPEAAAKRGIFVEEPTGGEQARKEMIVLGSAKAESLFIGENVYRRNVPVTVAAMPEAWAAWGADGLIGASVFQNVVLTIHAKAHTLTTSFPYRPAYMKLGNRDEAVLTGEGIVCRVMVDGQPMSVGWDLLENRLLVMNESDRERFPGQQKNITVAKEVLKDVPVAEGERTVLGAPLLGYGVFSLDIAKQKFYFQAYGEGEDLVKEAVTKETLPASDLVVMDRSKFLKEVWNYREHKEWKYEGNQPMIVDFWATWCGPCMRMLPVMEEMAGKYKGKVIFAKVNVDREKELRDVFNIRGIPYLLFITADGKLSTDMRAYTASELDKLITEKLLSGR